MQMANIRLIPARDFYQLLPSLRQLKPTAITKRALGLSSELSLIDR